MCSAQKPCSFNLIHILITWPTSRNGSTTYLGSFECHDNFEGGFTSQLAKLEFSKFYGDDPMVWSTTVEQYFYYQVIPNSQKVPITYFHVEGEANEW